MIDGSILFICILLLLLIALVFCIKSKKFNRNIIIWAFVGLFLSIGYLVIISLGNETYIVNDWIAEKKTIEISNIKKTDEDSIYEITEKNNNTTYNVKMNKSDINAKKLEIGYADIKKCRKYVYDIESNVYFARKITE